MRKVLLSLAFLFGMTTMASAQQTAEKLNRAPVAVKTANGILVSWRSLNTDAASTSFSVYRNGTQIASAISTKTNYLDADGKPGDTYRIVASTGEEASATAWSSMYTTIDLPRPKARKSFAGKTTGRYRPDDISVGDVDGDGEYELVLKWLPDDQRDSGKNGYSTPAYIDCYEMDGTRLWRIDLGFGVRSGNHYTQFLVYDFDGDGKAEVIFKTAAGTKDGNGKYVSEAATDSKIKGIDNTAISVNSNGHVTDGEEFLTVFNGQTGAAMHTIWYSPNRAMVNFPTSDGTYSDSWGDKSYNRGERYNAAVAYLDGLSKLPSAIMERGYYTYCYIWAVDWDGTALKTRWLHKGSKDSWQVFDAAGKEILKGSGKSSYGQGVHGISVGDVNADGMDDIVTGSATIAHDGSLRCSTGVGHGDAIHLSDLCPDRPGLEVMMPHEEKPYGYDVHDATTGEILASGTHTGDTGRGLAADFVPANRGFEFWSSANNNVYSCTDGSIVMSSKPDTNFRIYWTGDPFDQSFDGRYDSNTTKSVPRIRSYNTAAKSIITFQEFKDYGTPQTCNTTKATPCLQADILGDWREEIIMTNYEEDWSAPSCQLLIFSTPEPTEYKVTCLMQDHMYRMGVAWQNSSYNQPPHLGYYLPDALGVDGATYKTQTKNSAPALESSGESGEYTEALSMPAEDKGIVTGTCYTAGKNQEITNSERGGFIKVRTGNNGSTITFYVNEGYVITGMTISGYSNNSSDMADRSIYMTGVYVDNSESSLISTPFTFPGGTAGTDPVTTSLGGFEAVNNIKLTFDNTNIVSSDVDSAGKNKQLYASVKFTYKLSTGIEKTETVIIADGKMYNLQGQQISSPEAGQIYIQNGKKIIAE